MAPSGSSGNPSNPGVLLAEVPSSGKHYAVVVPNYGPAEDGTHSYVRLGAPHPNAGDPGQTALGEDLATSIASNDKALHTAGGTRDHTDGTRITTTRQHKIDVIGASYHRLVGQRITKSNSDPNWVAPSGSSTTTDTGSPTDATIYYDLVFANEYYNLVATTTVPDVANSLNYAPQRKQTTALAANELYEYYNGNDITEIYAGAATATEGLYAPRVRGTESSVYPNHPDWDTTRDDGTPFETPGGPTFDMGEFFLGTRVIEVTRGDSYLEERLVCSGGDFLLALGADSSSGTFTEQVWGAHILEHTTATLDMVEIKTAGATMVDVTATPFKFDFEFVATNIEVAVAAAIADLKAAIVTITEIAAAPMLFDIQIGALRVEASLGAEKVEYHNGHKVEASVNKTQVNMALQNISANVNYLHDQVNHLGAGYIWVAGNMLMV